MGLRGGVTAGEQAAVECFGGGWIGAGELFGRWVVSRGEVVCSFFQASSRWWVWAKEECGW